MEENDQAKIERLESNIDSVESAEITELPFEFFDKLHNKTTQLIATSGKISPIEGKNRWFEFKLLNPTIVTTIEILTQGYNEFHSFEFKYQDANGREINAYPKFSDDRFIIEIDNICRKLSFKPPSVWFSKVSVLTVRVFGLEPENLSSALEKLSDIASYKDEVLEIVSSATTRADRRVEAAKSAELERSAIAREVTALKSSVSRNKKLVEDLAQKKNQLITENSAAGDSIRGLKLQINRAKNEVEAQQNTYRKLTADVALSQANLKSLRDNINLFPSEIVEFVNQGSKNIRHYGYIIAVPMLIISALFIMLVKGAADLTTVITNDPNVNIEALMISRTPYVIISGAIITACYKIARVFISEMIKINNQRLSLTKISIIAKDVSSAAEHELDLPSEDIYRLRAELKMQLLRDHLKDYLSRDFKIELPRRLLGFIPLGSDTVVAEPKITAPESREGA